MTTPHGPSVATTTWTWLALIALTTVSFVANTAASSAGGAESLRFGAAFVKLALIAWVFMELGAGRGRWLALALALFAVTTVSLLLLLPSA